MIGKNFIFYYVHEKEKQRSEKWTGIEGGEEQMASSNQTATYKLSQWLENDPVLREDFNADHRKLESALVSLQTATNENRVVVGQYMGTGFEVTQVVNLGFKPRAVFMLPRSATTYGAMATANSGSQDMTITDSGFQVTRYQNSTDPQGTPGANPYRYLAFR